VTQQRELKKINTTALEREGICSLTVTIPFIDYSDLYAVFRLASAQVWDRIYCLPRLSLGEIQQIYKCRNAAIRATHNEHTMRGRHGKVCKRTEGVQSIGHGRETHYDKKTEVYGKGGSNDR
jgi:hypothetical protein